MNDKAKEIVIKMLIVMECIFGLFAIIIPIISGMCCGDTIEVVNQKQIPLPQPFYSIWIIDIIAAFITGVSLMVLLPVFGLKQEPVTAERLTSPYQSYEAVVNHISSSLAIQKYEIQPPYSLNDLGKLTLSVRKRPLKLDCFVVVRVPELTEELENLVNDSISASLLRYYGYDRTEQITDHVSMTALFCVDRVTAAFQKLVNSNIQQGFKNSRLPTGISFGSNTVYIAKQQDGYAIKEYKRLRKEFLAIMELTPEKKKKPDSKKDT